MKRVLDKSDSVALQNKGRYDRSRVIYLWIDHLLVQSTGGRIADVERMKTTTTAGTFFREDDRSTPK